MSVSLFSQWLDEGSFTGGRREGSVGVSDKCV
jgi:hypothetical protein